MTRISLSCCLLLLTVVSAMAQYIDREPTLDGILQAGANSDIQWNHSFSVAAASSGYGFSTQSLYLSHLTWQLADPLQLKLDLGLLQSTRPTGIPGYDAPQFIGGGELSWRPTDNTLFRFSIYHGPIQRYGWRQSPGFLNYDYPTQQ